MSGVLSIIGLYTRLRATSHLQATPQLVIKNEVLWRDNFGFSNVNLS